ncbi:hypothetical protein ES702_03463 [subsurface metagenome]
MKKITLPLLILLIFSSLIFAFSVDITKTRTVREFFKERTDLQIATDAVNSYIASLNEISTDVILKASELAKGDNRKTVLKRDVDKATEEVFRKAPMTISELMEKIKLLSIINLAELTKQVNAYGDELLQNK